MTPEVRELLEDFVLFEGKIWAPARRIAARMGLPPDYMVLAVETVMRQLPEDFRDEHFACVESDQTGEKDVLMTKDGYLRFTGFTEAAMSGGICVPSREREQP